MRYHRPAASSCRQGPDMERRRLGKRLRFDYTTPGTGEVATVVAGTTEE
jgi:hypothetical protein